MSRAITPTPARPRWERRKEARPAELLAAALDLFVEKGFAGTRLDDVATRAGVSKGTLYLYFANKEELFKEVVRQNIVARITQARDEVDAFDGPARTLIASLITTWWENFGATPASGISKLMMAESGNFPEIARFFLEEVIEPWHALLAVAIERGIARGEFRPVDVPTFVRVMAAPLVMLSLWQTSFGPCSAQIIDTESYLATAIGMVQAALAPT
ncbi:MAG: TetR/AcrR family transcriptional regulator [Burkholderiaceae bacterium]